MKEDSFQKFFEINLEKINDSLYASVMRLPASCKPIAEHILKAGGKRLRPLLVILCARIFEPAIDNEIYNLSICMELLHASTLLHDDVIDNASLRRGKKTAHEIFGSARTILAGDAMLALGNAIIAQYNNLDLVKCYSNATISTANGEIMEMSSLHNPELSEGEYLKIAEGKTACLIACSCQLGAYFCSVKEKDANACYEFGKNLGLAFQIIDDVIDFNSQTVTGKPCGGDLREGKMTPPLRLFRKNLSDKEKEIFDYNFMNNSFNDAECYSIIEKIKEILPKVRIDAELFLEKARDQLKKLPYNKETQILYDLTDFVGNRRK